MSFDSIACPSCKRRTITRRDFLYGPVDCTTQCGACGRLARLDVFSRFIVSCSIALVLPSVLLYGDVFYSGHLFLVSILFVFVALRIVCVVAFPLLALEPIPDRVPITRRQNMFIAATLLVGALVIDGFMAARFDPPEGYADAAVDNLKR